MRLAFVVATIVVATLPTMAAACMDSSGSPSPLPPAEASTFGDVAHDSFVLGDGLVLADGGGDDGGSDDALAGDSAADASDAGQTYPEVVRADSPRSYWRFGEASGSVAIDETHATNGTYHGGATLGAPGAIAGDTNTAATFDGTTGFVDLGTGFGFSGTAPMSIEAWVKPASFDTSYRRLASKEAQDGAGRQGWLMATHVATGGGTLSFERFRDGVSDSVGTTIPIGSYSHVVATYDGATLTFYLNGAQVDSTASARALASLAVPLTLAAYSDATADLLAATIDELAIYDHALAAARVLEHYRVGSGH